MAKFTCQIAWATLHADTRLHIILGVSVRVFLEEINIWIGRLSKTVAFPNMGGPHLIPWRPEGKEKAE